MRPTATSFMKTLGLLPDPWQIDVLESNHPRLLLNCCRQAGKSTAVAILALHQTIWNPSTRIVIVAPSFRQSSELFRTVTDFYERLGKKAHKTKNKSELKLNNDARIVCLPCNEQTIRGFSGVNLLILDEAARVPEDVYRAVRPMLIASKGRMICLSTPQGKRGFFYKSWVSRDQDWQRIEIPARKIPRFREEDLDEERRALGDIAFRQEYECTFETVKGLVYPEMHTCVVSDTARCRGITRKVGGIDFGYRNPFAAIWGHTDPDGVLWITNEHYVREQTVDWHAEHLPKDVKFLCDPHEKSERKLLIKLNIMALKANASRRAGISAVQSRIRNGGLRIVAGACPNLLQEAELYRWADVDDEEEHPEEPISENNHALDALRYLIMHLDENCPRRNFSSDSNLKPKPAPPRKKSVWQELNEHTGWTWLT